jgi:hypothetical protein
MVRTHTHTPTHKPSHCLCAVCVCVCDVITRQPLLNNYNDIIYGPGKCFHYYQIMSASAFAPRTQHNGCCESAGDGEAAKGIGAHQQPAAVASGLHFAARITREQISNLIAQHTSNFPISSAQELFPLLHEVHYTSTKTYLFNRSTFFHFTRNFKSRSQLFIHTDCLKN